MTYEHASEDLIGWSCRATDCRPKKVSCNGHGIRMSPSKAEHWYALSHLLPDAFKAHRSLSHNTRVLHRAVSTINFVIVNPENGRDEPNDFLVAVGTTLLTYVGPRSPGSVGGTRPFMAIGNLKHRPPTYRHDLENVLHWTLITDAGDEPPKDSVLCGWDRSEWQIPAIQNLHYMMKHNFPIILVEVSSQFQCLYTLAEALRPSFCRRGTMGRYGPAQVVQLQKRCATPC
ncbi:hypothetical protein K461DRAFT_100922 [Myriangium duriaei CBS 260.36]|uniref:Fungal-type protein kinase domain-containing protein n=1 Tax=Myriangium duriaei CBS 260.36 TaxID=1168546 RepID=A0A9P4J7R5_9PEZI|nr:hypothetical protein K461DRAFT_100922 [Myriangium duriaei CBS 260.36]